MSTNEITKDNLEEYRIFLDPDAAENIGREYYRAIAVEDAPGEFTAGLIWELKDSENDEKDTTSELSCYVETDGRVDGFLLVHRTVSGKLRVELFVNVGPDPKTELFHMARFSIRKAIEQCDDNTEIILIRRDVSSAKLAAFLFPTVKGLSALIGNRKEESA